MLAHRYTQPTVAYKIPSRCARRTRLETSQVGGRGATRASEPRQSVPALVVIRARAQFQDAQGTALAARTTSALPDDVARPVDMRSVRWFVRISRWSPRRASRSCG